MNKMCKKIYVYLQSMEHIIFMIQILNTGDAQAKQTAKVGDLLSEQKKWITGLENQKASIHYYMKQLYKEK